MLHATHTKSRSLSILQSIFLCFFVGSLKACISKPYIKYRKRTCLQYKDRLRSCLVRDSSLEGLLKGIPYPPGRFGTAPPVSSTLLFLCALASLFVVSSILEAAGRINLCHESWWAGVLGLDAPLLSCAIIKGNRVRLFSHTNWGEQKTRATLTILCSIQSRALYVIWRCMMSTGCEHS